MQSNSALPSLHAALPPSHAAMPMFPPSWRGRGGGHLIARARMRTSLSTWTKGAEIETKQQQSLRRPRRPPSLLAPNPNRPTNPTAAADIKGEAVRR